MAVEDLGFDLSPHEILEAVPDALLVTDADGRIVFVNAPLERLFGYRREELTGRPVELLIPERYRPGHERLRDDYVRNPYVRPMGDCAGLYARHKAGHEFPVEIFLSPLPGRGGPRVVAAVRDVSHHIRLEEQLRRSRDELERRVRERTEELEQANRRLHEEMAVRARAEEQARQQLTELAHVARLGVLGEMTSGLGHELNQPLAAITNYAQGCIRRLKAGTVDAATLAGVIQRISDEATRASEIIARFRRFAKKESLQREWVDAGALLGEALRLTEIDAEKHGVAVRFHGEDPLPRVFVDPLQIQQVIVNLVRNAIEAMAENPGTGVVVRAAPASDGMLEVAVVDRGHGLAAENLEQLFRPFFTTKPQGLGIGLSISRRIVEAHGGVLRATPNEAGGMTFSMTLPLTEGEADGP